MSVVSPFHGFVFYYLFRTAHTGYYGLCVGNGYDSHASVVLLAEYLGHSLFDVNYAVKNNGTLPFRLFFGCKGKAIYFINQIFGRKNDEWFKKLCGL